MDVDVRELGASRVVLHVSLGASEVQGAFDRTYSELSQRGGVRGFRPGKVPRSVLERHYDPEVIRAVTYETLLQERLQEACEEHDLRPVEQIHIEVGPPPDEDEVLAGAIKAKAGVDEAAEPEEDTAAKDEAGEEQVPLVEGEAFEFHSVFTVFPRPKLPDLSELRLRRPVTEVTDEQLEERLAVLRELRATEVELDRKEAAEGDLVTADIVLVLEGEERGDAEPQEQEFVIGQRDYDPPIDRALIGHEVGETVEVPVEYPEDYPDEELAGKRGVLHATITSVMGRELPDLNDEFAQSLGAYQTLDELRAQIRTSLEEAQAEYATEQMRSQVLRFIADGTEIDLPDDFVDDAAERSYEGLMRDLERSGMSIEDFADSVGADEETLRENQRVRAEGGLKLHFALDKLIEQRQIEVTEADLIAEMQRLAEESGADLQVVQQAALVQPGFGDELRDRARRNRLLDGIIAEAQVEDVPREEYDRAETEVAEAAQAEEQPGAATDEQEAETQ